MTATSKLPAQKTGCSNCIMRGLGLCTVLIDMGWERPYAAETSITQKKSNFAARRTIFHPNTTLEGVPVICEGWATSIMKPRYIGNWVPYSVNRGPSSAGGTR